MKTMNHSVKIMGLCALMALVATSCQKNEEKLTNTLTADLNQPTSESKTHIGAGDYLVDAAHAVEVGDDCVGLFRHHALYHVEVLHEVEPRYALLLAHRDNRKALGGVALAEKVRLRYDLAEDFEVLHGVHRQGCGGLRRECG